MSSDSVDFIDGSDRRLADAEAGRLNELIESVDSQFVAFLERDAVPPREVLVDQADSLASDSSAIACLATGGRIGPLWSSTSPRVAVLIAPPEQVGCLLLRGGALTASALPEVGHPLWDRLIRQVASGAKVLVEPSDRVPAFTGRGPSLAPGEPPASDDWLRAHLLETAPGDLVDPAGSHADAVALKAGLLQVHDFLEESHVCCQSVQHEGIHNAPDYWHAIMHRREPDYGNSKYWWHHTGEHPLFPELAAGARTILVNCDSEDASAWSERLTADGRWDPFGFVDLCALVNGSNDMALVEAAEQIQHLELSLLLGATYADATG
ncbi:MAG: hypothetical protein CMJ48_04115 [Planctomycetaceae bacterium]|nr:hypothetical protein [Planctomycetaceae bacterium]